MIETFHSSFEGCVLISGRGRSGTTWIGQVLGSHPGACYKYEPFSPGKRTTYADWLARLGDETESTLRESFADLCWKCDVQVDLPPFFDKAFRRNNRLLLRATHALSARSRIARPLYEWYARPRRQPGVCVLIKEVNFPNEKLPRLCEVLRARVLGIIRNPFGNIASIARGWRLGKFRDDRAQVVERIRRIASHRGGEPYQRYLEGLDDLPPLTLSAITWRIQAETLAQFIENYAQGKLLIYEDVCRAPVEQFEEIFRFVGWDFPAESRSFLEETIGGSQSSRSRRDGYYSVFRVSRESADKWRTQLSADEIAQIAIVVRDSPLIDRWSDLPVD